MFIVENHLGDLELEKKETDGLRLYKLPSNEWVPSITSVTSFYNREVFREWRKRVGNEEADRVTKEATRRGTDFHEAAQAYLENKELDWNDYQPLTQFMFHSAKSSLDKIGKIHAIERTLYSEYLGLAGRVDCIAEYDGELAVIDFKTSKKIKPEEWIEQYFVQEVAYACMYYELTGIPIQKLITIMVTPNGEVKVYDKRNKGDYIKLLSNMLKNLSKTEWWLMGDINKALKEKFLCSAQFAQDIEAIVKDDNLGYIDAIVHYCEQNAIDVESVPKLISKPLKEKLKWEATELNYLKRTTRAKQPLRLVLIATELI